MSNATKIRMYGPIGGMFGCQPEDIIGQIPHDATNVDLHIHSPGGVVGDGIAIYHALKDHPARIRTVIDGDAHSIASIIFLAGDDREAYMSSRSLVHNAWVGVQGDAKELRHVADMLDATCESIVDIYQSATGMDRESLKDLMDESRYMRGSELVEKGFATALVNDPEAENQIAAMQRLEQEANDQMSATNKLKAAIERAEQAEELAATNQTRVDEISAEIETGKESAIAVTAELDALKVEIATATETHAAELAKLNEAIDARNTEFATAIEEHAEAVKAKDEEIAEQAARADKAELALAEPHNVDAAVAAVAGVEPEAIEAGGEANTEPEDETPALWEQYNALEDPRDRAKFWKANESGLKAEGQRFLG